MLFKKILAYIAVLTISFVILVFLGWVAAKVWNSFDHKRYFNQVAELELKEIKTTLEFCEDKDGISDYTTAALGLPGGMSSSRRIEISCVNGQSFTYYFKR